MVEVTGEVIAEGLVEEAEGTPEVIVEAGEEIPEVKVGAEEVTVEVFIESFKEQNPESSRALLFQS